MATHLSYIPDLLSEGTSGVIEARIRRQSVSERYVAKRHASRRSPEVNEAEAGV